MNITNEYAGTTYDFPYQATRAAVVDWITECGRVSEAEAAALIKSHSVSLAEELAENVADGDWKIPNEPDAGDPVRAVELLLDFAGEFGE